MMRLADANLRVLDRGLPGAGTAGFFLSSDWLGTTVRTAPEEASLALLEIDGRVGALLGRRRTTRHRVLPVRQWFLNETGHPVFDRVALEYNGLAGLAENTDGTRAALHWLLHNLPDADELVVRNATAATAAALRCAAADAGWAVRCTNRAPSSVLDLEPLRTDGRDALVRLGKNTRAAIRRSIRLYEADGPIRVHRAESVAEALAWFDCLAALHVASWQGRATHNAFTNRWFHPFHQTLIATAHPHGYVDLLRISAGDREIGYLYNFSVDGWTMAYQAGLAPAPDNRWKPGLVCHSAAIDYCTARGDRLYDFLAGPARYKRSLSNREIPMQSLVAFAPRWHLRLEDAARRLKTKLRKTGAVSRGNARPVGHEDHSGAKNQ